MRKSLLVGLLAAGVLFCASCGKETPSPSPSNVPVVDIDITNPDPTAEPTVEVTANPADEDEDTEDTEVREGFYRSELTNEWISEDLKEQRPMAVMVDNEITALDHYGVNAADIVYEIVNSLENDRVTRLMVIIKDWKNIVQMGSIRSVRPTNFMLAVEYNAVLLHDGGPYHINPYLEAGYTPNISGDFARFSNGKPTEFTEYVTYNTYKNPKTGKSFRGLKERIESSKISQSYTDETVYDHLKFAVNGVDLSKKTDSFEASYVKLTAFKHNKSELKYNPDTELYEYYTYGKAHIDPLDDDNILAFKNVILQKAYITELDENGYMVYDIEDGSGEGYYITGGYGIPITWSKEGQTGKTVYINKNTGKEIILNTGKTYIALLPGDDWGNFVIE